MKQRTVPQYDAVHPEVSIVVLNFNKPAMTIECLKSIWTHTTGHKYQVIVVDNGSTQENFEKLANFAGPHELVRLTVNRFFGEGNNIGAERTKGQFLVFMNNDVTVTPNWLEPLVEVFHTHSDAGSAGPKFVYPSGELQEAGALLDVDGSSVQIGKFQSPDDPRFNRFREVDYVSAATVIMRRKDFFDVRGFDFRYEPAYYEDVDLCLKIASLGKTTYYVPQSKIIHHENITTADDSLGLNLTSIIEVNKDKFCRRWNAFLETARHDTVRERKALIAANPHSPQKTAGFYTPYNIIPGGGERYLFSAMQALENEGYQITLILPELYSRVRISEVLDSLEMSLGSINITTISEAMTLQPFDVYFCLGNEILPSSRGLGKNNLYCCQFPFPSDPSEVGRRLPWLADYSTIVCYSDFVETAIRARLADTDFSSFPVEIVSPPVGLLATDHGRRKSGILGIGRFFAGGHCKRQDMMIEVLRDLVDRGVETELHLVGSLHPEAIHRDYLANCRQLAEGLPVTFHIDASPEKLGELLQGSLLYWHGAGFGVDPAKNPEQCEHFGISVIEAMSAGVIPFVVAHGGPSMIVEDGVSGFHYTTKSELADLSQRVLELDEPEKRRLRDTAIQRSRDFSVAAFHEKWRDLLDKTGATPATKTQLEV